MVRQRLSAFRSRLLLLVASTVIALVAMSGVALATVPVNGPGGWQTSGFTVTITDGYSYNNGATMSCTDSGGGTMTYYGAGPNSGGVLMEQQWYVNQNGVHTFNCTVVNSNKTASDTGTGTFYMDNMTPWAQINVGGGTMGANGWYTSFPSVWGTYGNVGPSGTWSSGCGGSYNPGSDAWSCSITDYNNLGGSSGTTINYDPDTPAVSTNVSGGAQANGWYGTAPSITASTSNVGPSGIAGGYPTCTGLSNGTNSVTCSVRDNNGLASTDAATTIKLDNQTPSNSVPSSTGTWYTSLAAIPTLSLSASETTDYSGITSIACTNPNNGSAGNYSVTQAVSASASLTGTYPTGDLAIGTNTISCTSTTGAGNTRSRSFTVLYDPQVPTAQISTSASSTVWYSSVGAIPGLVVSGTVGASAVKSFTCSGDGISPQSYANNTGGTINLTGLNQGSGTITCTLTANNGLSATTSQALQLDTTTPSVAYTTNAKSTVWYSKSDLPNVTVGGSTTGGSGIADVTCNGDGLPNNYTISGASGILPSADLNEGTGTVVCSSTSGAGLTSSTASLTVNIDDTVPTATITSTANTSTWYTTVASIPAVNVSAASGPSGITWITCSAPGVTDTIDNTSGAVDLAGLRDGSDTITCTPVSGAGISGASVTLPVNLDSRTPTLAFAGHASQTKWYDSVADIPEIDTNTTVGPSGLASIDCSGDGITSQSAVFSGAPVNLTGLNQGSGTITCTVTSGAGTSATASFGLNLDSSTPTASWDSTESQTNWYSSAASVPAINVNATTTGGSGVDHITCTGLSATETINGGSGTITASRFASGTNTISCAPVSGAGVVGASITRTVLLDASSPTIVLTGTDETTWYPSAQTVVADASANTNPSGVQSISCAVDGGTPTVTNAATATQDVTADGVHTVTCQPQSGAGVAGQSATTTVKIDSQSPAVTQAIIPAAATAPAGTVEVQITGSETNSLSGIASTSCSLDGQTPTVVTGSHQSVAISSAGAHTLDCTSTTGAGITSTDSSQTYTVNADPTQFSLSYGVIATSWQAGPVAVPVALTGATASNYQSLTCTVNGAAPTTITGTSGTVNVAASGTDRLDCYATGANGAKTAAVQQLIRVDNQAPTATWSTTPTSTGEKITLLGSEPTPLSGIASESCVVDSGSPQTASSSTLTVALTGNGTHQLACTMTTGAGVSANVSYTAHVAVPVPTFATISAPDPDRWYRVAQSIVIGIPTTGPTVASVVCSQGGTSTTYPASGSTITISVPPPGGNVQCYDVDSTGAQSSPVTFPVHIDTQAPTGQFLQTGPKEAIASINDPGNGSGIRSATVQYQTPGGQWTTLTGSYNPSTGEVTADIPYALQQPGAQYTLQALAVDYAGNSSVISTMQDGSAASSSVPNPDAGAALSGGLYAGSVAPGARGKVLKIVRTYCTEIKTITVNGRTIRRRVRVLVLRKKYVWEINRKPLAKSLTFSYGQPVTLTGTLTLTSGLVAQQQVTIVQQSGSITKRLTATTNASGAFATRLPLHRNSTVTYTVAGVSSTARIRVHGTAVVHLNGRSLLVRLLGATGKARFRVQQFRAGAWHHLGGTYTTNPVGRARITVPANSGSAAHLRVLANTQPNWQYIAVKETA